MRKQWNRRIYSAAPQGKKYDLWAGAVVLRRRQREARAQSLGRLVASGRVVGIVLRPLPGASGSEDESWNSDVQAAIENCE